MALTAAAFTPCIASRYLIFYDHDLACLYLFHIYRNLLCRYALSRCFHDFHFILLFIIIIYDTCIIVTGITIKHFIGISFFSH